ncbi:MAG: leucyl aminopeptidase [Actinobacteria bacterium]|nr:leucyl aminopeptidase [Actinomycetota bacterium]
MSNTVMGISVTLSRTADASTSAVGIPIASDGPLSSDLRLSRKDLSALGFEAKSGQTLVLPSTAGSKQVRILVGIGDVKSVTPSTLRSAAASLARAASGHASLSTALVSAGRGDKKANAQAVVEGLLLATHRYVNLKNDKSSKSKLSNVVLVATDSARATIEAGVARGHATAEAVCRARDFANTPPGHLTARMFADQAVDIAKASGLRVQVYNRDQLEAMGCGGMIGVNKGSVEPPRMVKLTYTPRNAKGKVVLVGKGVMYDSGGISLKPSDPSHAAMKMDMSGAAAVLCAMASLRDLKVRTSVVGYLMCTDNMPSGSALRMGDVITMRNGKTVEIHNTDAEGRLILADGLSLAVESKPDAIVDIATLTGACMAALGKKMAGVLGNNQSWVDQVKSSSDRTDELVWQLPLHKDYRKLLDSNVADMRNIGGPLAGTITAALFLNEFVADVPWAHLDIAGPMDTDGDDGWLNRGATAFGTRLLIDVVENFRKPRK